MIPVSQREGDNDNQSWIQVGIDAEFNDDDDDDVPSVNDEPCDGDEPYHDDDNESGIDDCVIIV